MLNQGARVEPSKPGLSFDALIEEAKREFGDLDRGVWRTVWLMLTAPGRTLAELRRGEQPTLTRPLRFFMIVFSVYAAVWVSTGAMDALRELSTERIRTSYTRSLAMQGIDYQVTDADLDAVNPLTLQAKYPLPYELVVVGLLWLASFTAFAKLGYSAAERLAITLYVYATVNLIQIPAAFFMHTAMAAWYDLAVTSVMAAYLAWTLYGLIEPHSLRNLWRGLSWWLTLLVFSSLIGVASSVPMLQKISAHAAAAATQSQPTPAETSPP